MFTRLAMGRTVYPVAFVVACILFAAASPPASAGGVGVAPVLSATPGDGQVDLSWTDWVPPPDEWENDTTLTYYYWRMKVEDDDRSDWTRVNGTSTTVSDLENGKPHSFEVKGHQRGIYLGHSWQRNSPTSNAVTVTPKALGE